jgi:hypothetical protein
MDQISLIMLDGIKALDFDVIIDPIIIKMSSMVESVPSSTSISMHKVYTVVTLNQFGDFADEELGGVSGDLSSVTNLSEKDIQLIIGDFIFNSIKFHCIFAI